MFEVTNGRPSPSLPSLIFPLIPFNTPQPRQVIKLVRSPKYSHFYGVLNSLNTKNSEYVVISTEILFPFFFS